MQCNEFSSILEQQGLAPLPEAAQDHLAACAACQDFLADLSSLVASAKQLPSELDPPQRVWVSLRAQLEVEGLIKEPAALGPSPSSAWRQRVGVWFTPRSLATAGVGIALAIAAFLTLHKPNTPASPVAQQQVQPQAPQQVLQQQAPRAVQPPGAEQREKPVPPARELAAPTLAPPPSEDIYFARSAALNQAENDVTSSSLAGNPALEESLRKNLRTVNEFIAECEKHLKKHPHDTLAREYLNSAYQQKAELLAAMLDSGRSEQ